MSFIFFLKEKDPNTTETKRSVQPLMGSGQQATENGFISQEAQQTHTDSDQWVLKRRKEKIRNTDLIWHADGISSSPHVQLSGRVMSKGQPGDPSLGNVPIWCTDTQTCTMSCQRWKGWTLLHIQMTLSKTSDRNMYFQSSITLLTDRKKLALRRLFRGLLLVKPRGTLHQFPHGKKKNTA